MTCTAGELQFIIEAEVFSTPFPEEKVMNLYYDSRKIFSGNDGLFFALKTAQNNGVSYLDQVKDKQVRNWVVQTEDIEHALQIAEGKFNVFGVKNSLSALQKLAAWKRNQFQKNVIGITGSNGKTIVKEWLAQMLTDKFNLTKSPKSFNSQIGVPLSVWQLQSDHDLGIFEAGISTRNEMGNLANIIRPNLGIFTNIGAAHENGFANENEKIKEKLLLFAHVEKLVLCKDHHQVYEQAFEALGKEKLISWSMNGSMGADLNIETKTSKNNTVVSFVHESKKYDFTLPFADGASIENVVHCLVMSVHLGLHQEEISKNTLQLRNLEMRLELKQGTHGCYLIDDSYNNDIQGLQMALEFMSQQSLGLSKTLIVSEFLSSQKNDPNSVLELASKFGVKKCIWVGKQETSLDNGFFKQFDDTQALLGEIKNGALTFENELVLVKGARSFEFERVIQLLERKSHGTVLEINLNKLQHNVRFYKNRLSPKTKLMAMVKASAYGSGLVEIAQSLHHQPVDYFGVAYVDEGVELREKGIRLPIMVMNATGADQAELCLNHNLEPAIHGFEDWKEFANIAKRNGHLIPIHLAIDTGMHRLGFDPKDWKQMAAMIESTRDSVVVKSVYSHLVGADEAHFDDFTAKQIQLFEDLAEKLQKATGQDFMKHICNSAGILRFPLAHFDMVRLGIGLYGIDPTEEKEYKEELQPIVCLKTNISQITFVPKDETVGYSRKGVLAKDSKIATLALGYGDGYPRKLGNGNAFVLVKGKKAPTVGNICMDMMMVDISEIEGVEEGDEVVVFGNEPSIYDLANQLETIPYEILTNIGSRVKRVFFGE